MIQISPLILSHTFVQYSVPAVDRLYFINILSPLQISRLREFRLLCYELCVNYLQVILTVVLYCSFAIKRKKWMPIPDCSLELKIICSRFTAEADQRTNIIEPLFRCTNLATAPFVEHMQWCAEQIFSDNTYIHDIHDFTQKQTILSVKIHSPVLFL